MRVLLIKPSNLSDHIQPSLGLGYLAAQIRNDHEVQIVDCIKEQLPGPQLLPILEEFKPDVVGSQCYSMDLPKLKPVLETVKKFNPEIATIVGGAHATAAPARAASKSLSTRLVGSPVFPMRAFNVRRNRTISSQPAIPADAVKPTAPQICGMFSQRGK